MFGLGSSLLILADPDWLVRTFISTLIYFNFRILDVQRFIIHVLRTTQIFKI
jgi:hypothetical protein